MSRATSLLALTLVLAAAATACASPTDDDADESGGAGSADTAGTGPTEAFKTGLKDATLELLASTATTGGETKVGQTRSAECVLTGLASGASLKSGDTYAVDAPHITLKSSDAAHLAWSIPLTRTTAPTAKVSLSCTGGASALSVAEVQDVLRAGAHGTGSAAPQLGASARLWTAQDKLPATGATGPELFQSQTCSACHAIDRRRIGPAYKDVAEKYKTDSYAVGTLSDHILKGSQGRWGQIPMPANGPRVSERSSIVLARWVLAQK
jgi:cytochrome c